MHAFSSTLRHREVEGTAAASNCFPDAVRINLSELILPRDMASQVPGFP
jgi:hypothetical protein